MSSRGKEEVWLGQLRMLFKCVDAEGCGRMCAFVRMLSAGPSATSDLLNMTQLQWAKQGRRDHYECIPAHSILRPVLLQAHPKKQGQIYYNAFAREFMAGSIAIWAGNA